MWAMFVRRKEMHRGQFNYTPWEFAGLTEYDEVVSEREENAMLEHGHGSFQAFRLED